MGKGGEGSRSPWWRDGQEAGIGHGTHKPRASLSQGDLEWLGPRDDASVIAEPEAWGLSSPWCRWGVLFRMSS